MPRPSFERFGFAAAVLLTFAPVVVQGLWRPLASAADVPVHAVAMVFAALAVATTALLALWFGAGRGHGPWRPGATAAVVAVVCGAAIGRELAPAVLAIGTLVVLAALCGAWLPWLVRRLPTIFDGRARHRRGTAALLVLLGLLTATSTTRLSIYIGDTAYPEQSVVPWVPFIVKHSCLTAYVEGARLADAGVDNLYDSQWWPDLSDGPQARANAARYAPFGLDAFAYPPPFLLLPRVVLAALPDFLSERAVWFALNAVFVGLGLWTVARWIGGKSGARTLLLSLAVFASPATLLTLQVGNAHAAIITSAMLALVAFEKRRPGLGGALLAFSVVSKISPGLILVVLLVQRRFREVIWTLVWMGGFALLALLVFGPAPFRAFLGYQLPRLDSGEALQFLAGPDTVPINLSPFGLPFKALLLGVDVGDPWEVARRVNLVFSVVILAMTVWSARKRRNARGTTELWAAVLTLAALRSPLAPSYVTFSLMWLLSIWAIEVRTRAGGVAASLFWIFLAVAPHGTSTVAVIYGLGYQVILISTAAYFMLRTPPDDEEAPLGA